MGVSLSSPNISYEMGYVTFGLFRIELIRLILGNSWDRYISNAVEEAYWNGMTKQNADIVNTYVKCCGNTGKKHQKDVARLIRFILAEDTGGKLKSKWCKSIRRLMHKSKYDWQQSKTLYGYVGHGKENCMTLIDFYRMLEDGIETGKGIKWT